MPLSEREADKQAEKLARRLVSKVKRDKGFWSTGWKRTDILKAGYSQLIFKKIVEYGSRETATMQQFLVILYGSNALLIGRSYQKWVAAFFILLWLYSLYNYRKCRLSYADNLAVLDELETKLGKKALIDFDIPEEHPLLEKWNRRLEKRALLWRLDAFLSRKSVKNS